MPPPEKARGQRALPWPGVSAGERAEAEGQDHHPGLARAHRRRKAANDVALQGTERKRQPLPHCHHAGCPVALGLRSSSRIFIVE
jgi:hypothetical protein